MYTLLKYNEDYYVKVHGVYFKPVYTNMFKTVGIDIKYDNFETPTSEPKDVIIVYSVCVLKKLLADNSNGSITICTGDAVRDLVDKVKRYKHQFGFNKLVNVANGNWKTFCNRLENKYVERMSNSFNEKVYYSIQKYLDDVGFVSNKVYCYTDTNKYEQFIIPYFVKICCTYDIIKIVIENYDDLIKGTGITCGSIHVIDILIKNTISLLLESCIHYELFLNGSVFTKHYYNNNSKDDNFKIDMMIGNNLYEIKDSYECDPALAYWLVYPDLPEEYKSYERYVLYNGQTQDKVYSYLDACEDIKNWQLKSRFEASMLLSSNINRMKISTGEDAIKYTKKYTIHYKNVSEFLLEKTSKCYKPYRDKVKIFNTWT